jgi:hypothetical protein
MKSEMQLSEAQKILIGGLKLLNLNTDNIMMVGLMLRSESKIMEMLEWLYQNSKSNIIPSQEQVMDKAQEIMLNLDKQ